MSDTTPQGGQTALHAASENGDPDLVDLLLKQGATPDLPDNVRWQRNTDGVLPTIQDGKTPLDLICFKTADKSTKSLIESMLVSHAKEKV